MINEEHYLISNWVFLGITHQWKEEGKRNRAGWCGVGRLQGPIGEAGSVAMDTCWLWCPSMLLGVTAGSSWFGPSFKPVQ